MIVKSLTQALPEQFFHLSLAHQFCCKFCRDIVILMFVFILYMMFYSVFFMFQNRYKVLYVTDINSNVNNVDMKQIQRLYSLNKVFITVVFRSLLYFTMH